MGIGGGIFLMAVGAILTFGVTVEPYWLDLDVVGWVLMVAGGTIVLLTIWFWQQRRWRRARAITEEAHVVPSGPVRTAPTDAELRSRRMVSGPADLPPKRAAPPP